MITKLKRLWQQAFGDTDAFLDAFFATGYSPERCRFLTVDGQLAAVLYWFDCHCGNRKFAYLYAVATDKKYQNQGLCRQLINETHAHLRDLGYDGAILVPGSNTLFGLYEKLGYRTFGYVSESDCTAGAPVPLRQIDPAEYAQLRQQYLPKGGVVQEGAALAFLATFACFYAGDGFVLSATTEQGKAHVHELLGDADGAGIVAALGAAAGHIRMPGHDMPFAMYCSFSDAPTPTYFGIALD